VFLFVLILAMPLMIAESTEVKIKTVIGAEVQMSIYNAGGEFNLDSRIGSYSGMVDNYGDIKHDFEISNDEFNLMVFVKREGKDTIMEKFLDKTSGEFVYEEIAPAGVDLVDTPGFEKGVVVVEEVEEIVNETINETIDETDVNETEGESSKTVGFSIFGDEGILSKSRIYYIGGFLALILVGGFVFAGVKHKMSGSKDITVRKLSELQQEKKEDLADKKEDIEDYKNEIDDAEKKIAEAQEDIKKIRAGEKIKDMKKKLEDDQAELDRLRGERE